MNARVPDKPIEWPNDTQSLYNSDTVPHLDVRFTLEHKKNAPNLTFLGLLKG